MLQRQKTSIPKTVYEFIASFNGFVWWSLTLIVANICECIQYAALIACCACDTFRHGANISLSKCLKNIIWSGHDSSEKLRVFSDNSCETQMFLVKFVKGKYKLHVKSIHSVTRAKGGNFQRTYFYSSEMLRFSRIMLVQRISKNLRVLSEIYLYPYAIA